MLWEANENLDRLIHPSTALVMAGVNQGYEQEQAKRIRDYDSYYSKALSEIEEASELYKEVQEKLGDRRNAGKIPELRQNFNSFKRLTSLGEFGRLLDGLRSAADDEEQHQVDKVRESMTGKDKVLERLVKTTDELRETRAKRQKLNQENHWTMPWKGMIWVGIVGLIVGLAFVVLPPVIAAGSFTGAIGGSVNKG